MSLKSELEELAASLEAAVPLATTRVEHIRVAGHATRARRLAQICPDESPVLLPEPNLQPLGPAVQLPEAI